MPSTKDLKQAARAFERGLKLESGNQLEQAFSQFDDALRLFPQDTQFMAHREMVKAQLVFNHIERGNALLAGNQQARAAAEFKAALELDPQNQFAQQRLADALQESALPSPPKAVAAVWEDSSEIRVQPKDDRATFHYRGDVRGLFEELTSAYGVKATFDDSVTARSVRFYVDDVDFFTALRLACRVSKTMWAALDAHQLLVAADNPENHKQFDRMSLGAFTLASPTTPQEATEFVNIMRSMFDLRSISSAQTNTVEVRGPQPAIAALTKLMQQLKGERPQVLLDISVYQISHNLTRNMGVHVPDQFNLFNIPAGALAALGGQNIQQLINQLVSSGGINQANSTSLSALLAQLGNQQNSIFSQPLATFGGGLTFEGLSLDQLAFQLSVNESWAQSLEHVTLRASQGNEATFHLGTRYPIVNATYAPIFNSSAISKVLGNGSFIPPIPSVSYEDLGVNLKAKPAVHGNGDVSIDLDLEVRSLTGSSNNGQPIISNREYKGSINLKDGERAVVAGQVTQTEQRSLSGIPGFGQVPGLNRVVANNSKSDEADELLIVITPHPVANTDRSTDEIWISEK